MSLTAIVTAALLGQSAFSLMVEEPRPQASDVAYAELSQGRAADAVEKLEARPGSDPAVLINLGAAYARAGQADKALKSYRAALASPEPCTLELADGTWQDSRVIARTAMRQLMGGYAQASR